MMMLVIFSAAPSLAFDGLNQACGDPVDASNVMIYKMNLNDFTAAQQTEVIVAAHSWRAGTQQILRGADFHFLPPPTGHLTSDGTTGDGTNNIRKKPDSWFDAKFGPDDELTANTGYKINSTLCTIVEADISVRKFPQAGLWSTELPSKTDLTAKDSIGFVVQHEMGHMLGLGHEDGTPNLMMEAARLDFGETSHRVGEDASEGLKHLYPHGSTGKNLFLQRWRSSTTLAPPLLVTQEAWTDELGAESGNTWSASAGGTVTSAAGPSRIWLHITGTETVSTLVKWYLSQDDDCTTGLQWTIGTRTPAVGPGTPYKLDGPAGGYTIPSTTPSGNYHLCAEVDPLGVASETSNDDNIIVSEKLFEVTP